MRIFTVFFVFSIVSAFLYSCSTNIPYAEEENMKRPYDLNASLESSGILLQYSVTNQENSFAGYNIYISNTSIADSEITARTLAPYIIDGTEPTVKASSEDYNLSIKKDFLIQYLRYATQSLVEGETYYIRMTAYSVNRIESLPSPEVSITY